MNLDYTFSCVLPNGVHARPASALEEVARRFECELRIQNGRTGLSGDAKSVLGIVATDIRFEDPCRLTACGCDAREAMAVLSEFLEKQFPACDKPLEQVSAPVGSVPPMLKGDDTVVLSGTPVSGGIGIGRMYRMGGLRIPSGLDRTLEGGTADELRRLDACLVRVEQSYDARLAALKAGPEAEVIKAHRSVSRDPGFRSELERAIVEHGCSMAGAVEIAEGTLTRMLKATGSLLLQERALDIQDVCGEVIRQAYPEAEKSGERIQLTEDTVCVAEAMTPGQFLSLDRTLLKGLVLQCSGVTSHTVILARSYGIPCVVGVPGILEQVTPGAEIVVDANLGGVIPRVTPAVRRYCELERRRLEARRVRLAGRSRQPGLTRDQVRIEVAANVSSADEVAIALEAGAEGIGLFRTEMAFMDREAPPSEEELYHSYRQAVEAAKGRPVILRTLDIGGDKPVSYLDIPPEENPFLGYRALRLYPEFEAVVRAQVRALIRASAHGVLKVMVPMLSCVEEAVWFKALVKAEQAACREAGIPFDEAMAVGAMLEIPAAVLALDTLCGVLDFFSVGTNDLLQYCMAVERGNRKVAGLYTPLNPAFLRLLKMAVETAHAREKWIGLCGEMGGQEECLPLLVGLGFDELSMAATRIAEVKAALDGLSRQACRALVDKAMAWPTVAGVTGELKRFRAGDQQPLLDPDLVVTGVECGSKAEAIKIAADRLYETGRTRDPRLIEEAVWAREVVSSTGFGHGFAIPHCKTDAVASNSLVVLKLNTPVEWGSLDGAPVGILILLAIRESDRATAHMRILAALARKIMHEEFRARLVAEADPLALCEFLKESLGGNGA